MPATRGCGMSRGQSLSQGAKPAATAACVAGGKVSRGDRGHAGSRGQDCVSPARHSAILPALAGPPRVRGTPAQPVQAPTGNKPLAIGHPWEWSWIAGRIREPGSSPVHRRRWRRGKAPGGTDGVHRPCRRTVHEALMLVHNPGPDWNRRCGSGSRGAKSSARSTSRAPAMGGGLVNVCRGCNVRAPAASVLLPHTDRCPTGIATQDRRRWGRLDVP